MYTMYRRHGSIPSTIQSTIQRYRIMHLHARIPMPNTIPNQILSHSYNADTAQSRTRLISGGATIFKEGDDSAGIATTPTANYRTGSAGTKHRETHSPIEKAGSGKCTWRRSNNCTPRTAKSARKEVMANAPTDESRSRMHKLQTRMRSRLSLGDPDSVSTIPRYTAATGNRLQNQS